jgi:hypothetical protein
MAAVVTATAVEIPNIDAKDFYEPSSDRPNRTHIDSMSLPTDSMVSVSLSSEAGIDCSPANLPLPDTPGLDAALTANALHLSALQELPKLANSPQEEQMTRESIQEETRVIEEPQDEMAEAESGKEMEDSENAQDIGQNEADVDVAADEAEEAEADKQEQSTVADTHSDEVRDGDEVSFTKTRSGSVGSSETGKVDWQELEQAEKAEPQDETSDEVRVDQDLAVSLHRHQILIACSQPLSYSPSLNRPTTP